MDRNTHKKKKSASQISLKPINQFSSHIQMRRSLLSSLRIQPSSNSPTKHKNMSSAISIGRVKVSNSQDLKSYISSNLKLMHSKANVSSGKLKPASFMSKNMGNYDSSRSVAGPLQDLLPKTITSISSKTLTGMVAGKIKKINQDAYFINNNFSNTHSQVLLGVLDGHGIYGGQVSCYVKSVLPGYFETALASSGKT